MDYNILLDLATDLGYELAMCGAETFRVEESVSRVLSSYGIASEVFAIPNYLIVTVMMEDGTPITRMRRMSIRFPSFIWGIFWAHWASGCCSAAIFWTASAPVFAGYW